MSQIREHQAIERVVERLTELLDLDRTQANVRQADGDEPGVLVDLGGARFVIEWKSSGAAASVARAIERLGSHADGSGGQAIPLVAVPFMGAAGSDRCAAAGVNWLDLSGNARIVAPGLRVFIEGKPNLFKRRGRPSSAFAPKSSRIARWLLMHPQQPATQREIAQATGVDEGFTSRIVSKLERDALVTRDTRGAVKVRDADLLLDAWKEEYDFSKHRIFKGHVPARSGEELLHSLATLLSEASIPFAVTGLSAAWALTRYAGFRIVTVYVDAPAGDRALRHLGVREGEQGANVWLVVPNDAGVFQGAAEHGGARCVHPVQAYLDLSAHPERAQEAAAELRSRLLKW